MGRRIAIGWALGLLVASEPACSDVEAFVCQSDMQCGAQGRCEQSTGYCAEPDASCPSGWVYASLAGGGLAGTCVAETPGTSTGPDTDTTTTTEGSTSTSSSTTGPTSSTTGVDTDPGSSGTTDTGSLPLDLVAWYRFEDDFGSIAGATDDGPFDLDATCSPPACPQSTDGRVGSGAAFDGSSSVLQVASTPEINLLNGFTVATFVRHTGNVANMTLVSRALGQDFDNSILLSLTDDDNDSDLDILGQVGSNADAFPVAVASPAPLVWAHVALVWTGAELSIYVDGTFVDSVVATDIDYDGRPLTIGADLDQGALTAFFTGTLDELQLYSRALGEVEIAQLAAMGG